MKYPFKILVFLTGLFVLRSMPGITQTNVSTESRDPVVIITGARFTYPLIQKLIDEYHRINAGVQIIIDARGSSDPADYDILVEAYEHSDELRRNREYAYIARYAIVPVANARSLFARGYAEKGVPDNLLKQLFFEDIFADKGEQKKIKTPYTVYTRLQKAGSPTVFANHYGYHQKDIAGKAIAGSDQHLMKAVLMDSTAITYLPLALVYDFRSNTPVAGLVVLPVDLDGNGNVSADEKVFQTPATLIEKLERGDSRSTRNLPFGFVHLSVSRESVSPEALEFIRWVLRDGLGDLSQFGFVHLTDQRSENALFEQFAAKRKAP